jgi:Spy/CpxP family protein refolding chaperone
MNRRSLWIVALGLGLLAPASMTFAQDRQGGNRGAGGGFDPARFQEEMLNRTKERLGATDEEWTILKPKIEKVMTAQRESMSGRFGGFGRGGDRGGNSGARSAAAQASSDLRDALENKDTPPDQIAAKVKALRDARAKAKADLEAAQKDLQAVLTPRQEAVLVSQGTLD